MNASRSISKYDYPFDLRWTPQDLAEAVPLRLHQMFAFDVDGDTACAMASANSETQARRVGLMHGFLPAADFHPRFTIR